MYKRQGPGRYSSANITNPSFEEGLTGWDQIGGGHGTWTGDWDAKKYIVASDGFLLAYTDSGISNDGDDAGLSQTLIETLTADTTYTLMVDVANDGYYNEEVSYRVQLLAGGSILAEDNNEQHELPIPKNTVGADEWETSVVVYEYDEVADANKLGEPLEIRLLAIDGTWEMSFDNVRLTAEPGFPIPSDSTYTLKVTATDDLGSDSATVEIDVYDDACSAARVGLSLAVENPGDIVGDSDPEPDCVTDIYDLALMALTWLDNKDLTEPLVIP